MSASRACPARASPAPAATTAGSVGSSSRRRAGLAGDQHHDEKEERGHSSATLGEQEGGKGVLLAVHTGSPPRDAQLPRAAEGSGSASASAASI